MLEKILEMCALILILIVVSWLIYYIILEPEIQFRKCLNLYPKEVCQAWIDEYK